MIDWQAHADGSMPAGERSDLESRLAEDAALQAERDGFSAFRLALQGEGLNVPVPSNRLEEALAAAMRKPATAPKAKPRYRLALAFSSICVLVLAYFAFLPDRVNFATTPVIATKKFTDMPEASAWLSQSSGLAAPNLKLASNEQIGEASYGSGWACYDFKVNASQVKLYMAREDSFDEFGTPEPGPSPDCATVFRGRGLGWRGQGMSYYLLGPADVSRGMLARLCAQTCRPKGTGGPRPSGPGGSARMRMAR